MDLTFLSASDQTPLAKRYVAGEDGVETHPYPQVRNFSSITLDVPSITDAYEALQTCAEQKMCLLKGNLDRKITDESRAGRTNPTSNTRWIALDLDFEDGFDSIDAFLEAIGLPDTSYVLHHSSSSGTTRQPGLRAHIYMQLAEATNPALLKEWLRHLNLTVKPLRERCELTASKMALRWPLDVTTCQNDKLLYIADPICEGVEDKMAGLRFELHERTNAAASPNLKVDPASVQAENDKLIGKLREDAGLGKAKPRTRWIDKTTQILLNPAQAIVTSERKGRGFVYLNLNGGDSWAYYYPENNPEYLHNFKGEPSCRLQDIVPEYAQQVQRPSTRPLDIEGFERFCVRDNRIDSYYSALRDLKTDQITLHRCAKQNLGDFMGEVGLAAPDPVPEYTVEFDPRTNVGFDPDKKWINRFHPSHYMLRTPDGPGSIPPLIDRVLTSVTGDDPAIKEHFINWLAFIFQYREKTQTSFVFHGIEGTGKGLLFSRILRPLIGHDYARMMKIGAVKDGFNEWVSSTLLLALDEVYIKDSDEQVPEILRNYVTESSVDMRAMRTDRQQIDNYINLLLFSNRPDMMKIPESDRRYTVAPRQTKKLQITEDEVIKLGTELPEFSDYLHSFNVDREKARRILQTSAKKSMQKAAEGTGERIFRAFATGDLQFFIDMMETSPGAVPDVSAMAYDALIRRWYDQLPGSMDVSYDEMRRVHRYLTGGHITKIAVQRLADTHLSWPQTRQGYRIQFDQPEYGPETASKPLAAVKSK